MSARPPARRQQPVPTSCWPPSWSPTSRHATCRPAATATTCRPPLSRHRLRARRGNPRPAWEHENVPGRAGRPSRGWLGRGCPREVQGHCGADMHTYRGRPGATLRFVLGYEPLGVVERLGPPSRASLPKCSPRPVHVQCGTCETCAAGTDRPALMRRRGASRFDPRENGGVSQRGPPPPRLHVIDVIR